MTITRSGVMRTAPLAMRLRAWDCEKCSDPECEHRLFTSLVAQREARQA